MLIYVDTYSSSVRAQEGMNGEIKIESTPSLALRVRVCDSEQLQECFTLAFSPTRCLWGVGVSMKGALNTTKQEVFFRKETICVHMCSSVGRGVVTCYTVHMCSFTKTLCHSTVQYGPGFDVVLPRRCFKWIQIFPGSRSSKKTSGKASPGGTRGVADGRAWRGFVRGSVACIAGSTGDIYELYASKVIDSKSRASQFSP